MNYVLQFIHPEQQGFLIPNFKNSPVNSDDICDIKSDWDESGISVTFYSWK